MTESVLTASQVAEKLQQWLIEEEEISEDYLCNKLVLVITPDCDFTL
jgi:hypothetical protein